MLNKYIKRCSTSPNIRIKDVPSTLIAWEITNVVGALCCKLGLKTKY